MSVAHADRRPSKLSKALPFVLILAGTAMIALAIPLKAVLDEETLLLLVGLGGISALIGSVLWFARLDEVAKHAHYVAWAWGGTFGFTMFGFAFVAAVAFGAPLEWLSGAIENAIGQADFTVGVGIGAALAGAFMSLGYTIWWAVFWLRRR